MKRLAETERSEERKCVAFEVKNLWLAACATSGKTRYIYIPHTAVPRHTYTEQKIEPCGNTKRDAEGEMYVVGVQNTDMLGKQQKRGACPRIRDSSNVYLNPTFIRLLSFLGFLHKIAFIVELFSFFVQNGYSHCAVAAF